MDIIGLLLSVPLPSPPRGNFERWKWAVRREDKRQCSVSVIGVQASAIEGSLSSKPSLLPRLNCGQRHDVRKTAVLVQLASPLFQRPFATWGPSLRSMSTSEIPSTPPTLSSSFFFGPSCQLTESSSEEEEGRVAILAGPIADEMR